MLIALTYKSSSDSLALCSALSPFKAHFEIMLIWPYSVKDDF